MRKVLLAGVTAIALCPAMALAQSPAEQGYHEGYRAGGPIGGIVGGTVGAAVEFPGDVLGFVTGHPHHCDRVREEEIVVGEPLPPRVHVYVIPSHREYVYAYVNDRRVASGRPRYRDGSCGSSSNRAGSPIQGRRKAPGSPGASFSPFVRATRLTRTRSTARETAPR